MGASGLGSLLVKEGLLTEQDRLTINKTCGQGSWAFAKSILTMGLLDEEELAAFVAERTRFRVAAKNFLQKLDLGMSKRVDGRMFSRLEILPIALDGNRLTVAVADPLDKATLAQLEFFTGYEIVALIAPLSQIYEGLIRLNPDFRPRYSALSKFLHNHAAGAWVKQKTSEPSAEFGQETQRGSSKRSRKKTAVDPELFAATRSHAPLDDDGPEDDFSGAESSDVDLDLDFQESGAEVDFGDAEPASDSSFQLESELDAGWEDKLDAGMDTDVPSPERAGPAAELTGIDELNDLDLDASLEGDGLDNLDAFDSMNLEGASASSEPLTDEEPEARGDSAASGELEAEDDPFSSLDSETTSAAETDFLFSEGEAESEIEAFADLDEEPKAAEPAETEVHEDAEFRADPDADFDLEDPLDAFANEPEAADEGLELSALDDTLPGESKIEKGSRLPSELLLASLDADQSESIDALDEPEIEAELEAEENLYMETRSGIAILEESLAADDTDLIDGPDLGLESLDPSAASDRESPLGQSRASFIPPTALVNQLLLRLSLCIDSSALRSLLCEQLSSLCPAGCLLLFAADGPDLISWREGKNLGTEATENALHFLTNWPAGVAAANWKQVELISSLAWAGEFSGIWIAHDLGGPACLWIGAHSLEDEAFTEALEELLRQVARRTAGLGLKVG